MDPCIGLLAQASLLKGVCPPLISLGGAWPLHFPLVARLNKITLGRHYTFIKTFLSTFLIRLRFQGFKVSRFQGYRCKLGIDIIAWRMILNYLYLER